MKGQHEHNCIILLVRKYSSHLLSYCGTVHATAATSNNILFFQQIMSNVRAHVYLEQLENTRPLLNS